MRQLEIIRRVLTAAEHARPAAHTVRVPFARWDKSAWASGGTRSGFIAWLILDILEREGTGQVAQDPKNQLHVNVGDSFRRSMQTAWEAAKALLSDTNLQSSDGRWRIEGMDENAAIDGASAGGAAALGWHRALLGFYPDPCLIVLAAMET